MLALKETLQSDWPIGKNCGAVKTGQKKKRNEAVKMLFSIAAGGAIGATLRYLVMSGVGNVVGLAFPWGTMAVNVVGSFVLGALVETMALVWSPGAELRAFLVVGILGAFTTFSTFSLDVVTLYERGAFMEAGFYVIASMVVSIAALFAGLAIARGVIG
jgi:CrcB protein